MAQKFVNDAFSTLAAGLGSSDTTLYVEPGDGVLWPEIIAPDFAYTTLENASGNKEIVKVTAHTASSDSMTIVRAQQGTTAGTWAIGDLAEMRITSAELTAFEADIDALDAGKQTLDADLTALAALSGTGFVVRTGSGAVSARTLQAGAGVVISNGNGVSADPTISIVPTLGTGDVLGPSSAVDSSVALFDGVSGKVLKDSGKAVPSGTIVGHSDSQVLTNKTINLANNMVSGTTAEFNAALSDGNFATQAGAETLTNKTISVGSNSIEMSTARLLGRSTAGTGAAEQIQIGLGLLLSGGVLDTRSSETSLLTGAVGWANTFSGGTADKPTQALHSKGTERLRETITWGTTGGASGNPQSILYEYSSTSGSSYDTVGTITYTYDASGNVTAWAWS